MSKLYFEDESHQNVTHTRVCYTLIYFYECGEGKLNVHMARIANEIRKMDDVCYTCSSQAMYVAQ